MVVFLGNLQHALVFYRSTLDSNNYFRIIRGMGLVKKVLERRRNSVGLCRKCGYDRNGLEVIAKCPERGSRTRSPLSNRSHRFVFHEKSITSVVSLDRFI